MFVHDGTAARIDLEAPWARPARIERPWPGRGS
jgi:hypothetical protein